MRTARSCTTTGRRWSVEQPPPAEASTAVTSVAVAGSGPSESVLAIAGGNLIVRQPDGTWIDADPSLLPSGPAPTPGQPAARLRPARRRRGDRRALDGPRPPARRGPFAYADQPIEGVPVALSAFEDCAAPCAPPSRSPGRAGSAAPFTPDERRRRLPSGDGELLIETADGWQDLSRNQPAGTPETLPVDGELHPDPVLGVAASPDGQHLWAVGGYDGTPTAKRPRRRGRAGGSADGLADRLGVALRRRRERDRARRERGDAQRFPRSRDGVVRVLLEPGLPLRVRRDDGRPARHQPRAAQSAR